MKNKNQPKPDVKTPFVESANLPFSRELKELLDAWAYKKKISRNNLIYRAIYNELSVENPFEYSTEFNQKVEKFDEVAHLSDAIRLLDFITKYPGLSLEHLMMLRTESEINIPDKIHFLKCFWYLFDSKQIIEPPPYKNAIRFYQGYVVNPYPPGVL